MCLEFVRVHDVVASVVSSANESLHVRPMLRHPDSAKKEGRTTTFAVNFSVYQLQAKPSLARGTCQGDAGVIGGLDTEIRDIPQ